MSSSSDTQFVDRLRRLFGDAPCKLQVAALPWRSGENGPEVMLITSRDTGRWVLPKGWVEKDKKLWRAAEREAEEEAGLQSEMSRKDVGRYFYAKVMQIGPAVPCEVVVYPLQVAKTADKWKEKGMRDRQWFPVVEAAELVDEPELREIIRRFGEDPAAHAA